MGLADFTKGHALIRTAEIDDLDKLKALIARMATQPSLLDSFISWSGALQHTVRALAPRHKHRARTLALDVTDTLPAQALYEIDIDRWGPSEIANALVFFPSATTARLHAHGAVAGLRCIDSNESALALRNRSTLPRLRRLVESGVFKRGDVSPEFVFEMALAACAQRLEDEARFLENLRELLDSRHWREGEMRRLIAMRITMCREPSTNFAPSGDPQIAVIVAGQMRGLDTSLPDLTEKLDELDADIYVSTWDQPGRTRLDRARIPRIFTPEAAEIVQSLSDDEIAVLADRIKDSARLAPGIMESRIRRALPKHASTDRLKINVEDEAHPVFRNMSNPLKMYYHNFYWPEKLGARFFSSNYTHLMKIRPDISFGKKKVVTRDAILSAGDTIATEQIDWRYESEGIGTGDQILYGRSDILEKLMRIWPGRCASTDIRARIQGKKSPVLGHSNLGLELWLTGADVSHSRYRNQRYFGDDLLGVRDLERLQEQLGN